LDQQTNKIFLCVSSLLLRPIITEKGLYKQWTIFPIVFSPLSAIFRLPSLDFRQDLRKQVSAYLFHLLHQEPVHLSQSGITKNFSPSKEHRQLIAISCRCLRSLIFSKERIYSFSFLLRYRPCTIKAAPSRAKPAFCR